MLRAGKDLPAGIQQVKFCMLIYQFPLDPLLTKPIEIRKGQKGGFGTEEEQVDVPFVILSFILLYEWMYVLHTKIKRQGDKI